MDNLSPQPAPRYVRLCPKHLTQPENSYDNCWCGLKPVWYQLANPDKSEKLNNKR